MKLNTLPFHFGGTEQAVNPGGLPYIYPFVVVFEKDRGLLVPVSYTHLSDARNFVR